MHQQAEGARLARGEGPDPDVDAINARVAEGAKYYDLEHPGWAQRVNLDRLWMNTPTACIRAQVEFDLIPHSRPGPNGLVFSGIHEILDIELLDTSEERHLWEYKHGMASTPTHHTHWEREEEYQLLERAWKLEILDRRPPRTKGTQPPT